MCAQLKLTAKKVSAEAASKHLSKKDRKRLAQKGQLIINCPENRQLTARMRVELNAVYVS